MSLIIDCHGHYTTAPKALENWRNAQIVGIKDPAAMPKVADLKISDDELRESIETNQLKLMKERGSDITLFSPRASFMAHHIGDFNVSRTWAAICNELCHRVSTLFPDHFVPVAMLPQSPGVDPVTCIPELEKCVKEYGAVGINLNPDPSGGHWTSPPLTDKHWYPIYEKMVEYDLPAMIHVSTSCNACFHTTGAHYLNADTTAFMQLIQGDLFKDFPTLKFLIPHGGGAVPYHWGRFRGLAQEMKKPLLDEHLMNNVFFDTCVYHQPGIDLLNTVIPVTNVLFASEMIGAVRGIDPTTCIPELEKCVHENGAVGINLNPDPSGGHWTSPPLTDKHWYPIYEKMVEYDLPAMIHVSTSCNACFHTTGAHYLNADTTAFMQLIQGDLFKDFPTLKFLIPHGGGAVPYHWGRFRGLAQEMKKPLLDEHLMNNVYFDTCVYHQPGIDLLNTVIPVKNVLFASEMIGAVRGIDPTTGHYYDDTKRYIEASTILSAEDKHQIYEANTRRVFSRLDSRLKAKGL